ncbi:TPA: alpha/beta fold hydrolase [Pasteurella multocida]|uniref:alpha/beta fold hydrolase n=1 Tax=Pasteurella multocida TaxID=747 RepID=UPI002FE051DA|nr:alpha/beta fold hydrolase [Pasteurella multocida]
MSENNLLHFQFHQLKQEINAPTFVFIHGLFGDMNNLGIIARAFSEKYPILRVDLRNHGQSFHHEEMNYTLMAEDLTNVIHTLQLKKVILIGHSMGGKTAMKMTALYPHLVEKLIVIDIAPVKYGHHGHDAVFAGLFATKQAKPKTRQEAKHYLAQYIPEEAIQQFMLKSFDANAKEYFRFNLSALHANYPHIMDWQPCHCTVPTLFIRGGQSNYIKTEDTQPILAQFPQATAFTINGCGHWVHAEKPEFVIRAIERFLISNK